MSTTQPVPEKAVDPLKPSDATIPSDALGPWTTTLRVGSPLPFVDLRFELEPDRWSLEWSGKKEVLCCGGPVVDGVLVLESSTGPSVEEVAILEFEPVKLRVRMGRNMMELPLSRPDAVPAPPLDIEGRWSFASLEPMPSRDQRANKAPGDNWDEEEEYEYEDAYHLLDPFAGAVLELASGKWTLSVKPTAEGEDWLSCGGAYTLTDGGCELTLDCLPGTGYSAADLRSEGRQPVLGLVINRDVIQTGQFDRWELRFDPA